MVHKAGAVKTHQCLQTKRVQLLYGLTGNADQCCVLGIDKAVVDCFCDYELELFTALVQQSGISIERIVLAEQVAQSKLAAEAERLRNSVLASISHDLLTPLVGIIGGLSCLVEQPQNYDQQTSHELLMVALQNSQHLHRFVENLLRITKIESGGLPVKIECNDLAEIVNHAISRLSPQLSGFDVVVAIADTVPMVMADFSLLDQSIYNLLDNASKYAPSGTAITITATAEDGRVWLDIADQGPGVPLEMADAIFNKFTRLSSGNSHPMGSGLGLLICRGFIEAMGGTIAVLPQDPGQGACFRITLQAAGMWFPLD